MCESDGLAFGAELRVNCDACPLDGVPAGHQPEKPKGNLRLDTRAGALKGGDDGTALVPGKPDRSPLYTSTILPADDDKHMPPKGDPLSPKEVELLRAWIDEGLPWDAGFTFKAVTYLAPLKPRRSPRKATYSAIAAACPACAAATTPPIC